jgi:thioredoxin reductase
MQFDVLIVGGGPAGLSAALILGRCHRIALLCDEGRQRNLSSQAIHGLLGRKGGPRRISETKRWRNSLAINPSRSAGHG